MKGLNVHDVLERIAEPLQGMDDDYVNLIRNYHAIYTNEQFSTEHKRRTRAQTIVEIKNLVADRVQAAKDVIDEIREEYSPGPEDTPELSDTEKLYNLALWREVLPYATVDELRGMYLEHGSDPDFIALLKTEFRKREGTDEPTDTNLQKLRHDIEHGPRAEGFADLDRLVTALNTFAAAARDQYPQDLAGTVAANLGNVRFRTVNRDLDAWPVDDGITFRPRFKLGEPA